MLSVSSKQSQKVSAPAPAEEHCPSTQQSREEPRLSKADPTILPTLSLHVCGHTCPLDSTSRVSVSAPDSWSLFQLSSVPHYGLDKAALRSLFGAGTSLLLQTVLQNYQFTTNLLISIGKLSY